MIAFVAASFAATANADVDSGAYLAGRAAAQNADFLHATRYFTQSLRSDPTNQELLENAMAAHAALGNFESAASLAGTLRELGVGAQVSNLILMTDAAKSGEWGRIFDALEAGHMVSPLVDGLAQAWGFVGQGNMSRAIETFEDVSDTEGMDEFAGFHHALALAMVGDFEGADAIFVEPGRRYSAQSAVAHAQVLSQLERNEDAIAMLGAVFGDASDPALLALKTQLQAGDSIPFSVVRDATDGLAEVMFLVAQLIRDDTPESYTLLYSRMAEHLKPDHTPSILMSGGLLEELGQFDLASDTYTRIPAEDPAFVAAELGRIDVLRRAGNIEAAIEAAQNLVRSHSDMPTTHDKLGDMLRYGERHADSIGAYTGALDLLPEDFAGRWLVLYKRAISYHLIDDWPPAEEDFRAALELNPGQPLVLNYLGYSLVERDEKLQEALDMIERAAAAAPENGAIIDSLGWVLFQLGRYDEAVGYMEQAASLEAVDPIVNDHLGDVYWAVGRKIEATFQWNRALSFDPEEELADRIRKKLSIGLDAVLEEEGADPLSLANDDG